MTALTYINGSEREVSLHDLEWTCTALCEHIDALRTIAITNSENSGNSCEEAGLMMLFASSLADISQRLSEMTPRIE